MLMLRRSFMAISGPKFRVSLSPDEPPIKIHSLTHLSLLSSPLQTMPKSAPIPSVFRSTNTNDNTQQSQSQTRPLTLSELADRASKASKAIPFSNSVPINRYIAGAESLKQQANAYQREKRNEDQFICLVKCARLLVELLPTHHGWHETNEEVSSCREIPSSLC